MKSLAYILLLVLIIVLTLIITIEPFIIFLAKVGLERAFIGSSVSIGDCKLRLAHQLILFDIKIKKQGVYDSKICQIGIQFQPSVFLNRGVSVDSLKEAITAVNLEIDYLDIQGLRLEGAYFKIGQLRETGGLYIQQLRYGKAKIREVNSRVRLSNNTLLLDSLTAKSLGGNIIGDLSFAIDDNREFLANLKFINFDLATIVDDFNLGKKIRMTGKLTGNLDFKGKGLGIDAITGYFSTAEYGGVLIIKDTGLLENLARNSGQPLDILVESFKNYHYNTGVMRLSLENGDLILDVGFDGETGKRNLNITLHDFKLRRHGL